MEIADPIAAGTRLGNLTIEAPVGADEAGDTYIGRVEPVRLKAIVKILSPQLSANAAFLQQLRGRLAEYSKISSPHIAQMVAFDQMTTIQRWLLVTSIGNSVTLAERIAKKDLSPPSIVAIMRQTLTAMQSAHKHNFIHTDLTPENIMINLDGKVKILNFPFFDVSDESKKPNVEFWAPEYVKTRVPSESADIFSLGMVFQRLFQSIGIARIPTEIRRVSERMCTHDPMSRFPSMTAALEALGADTKNDALDDAQKIITRSFERTKTIQLQVDTEVRNAKFRERLPSPFTVVILAVIAYFSYTKVVPMFKGKSIPEMIKTGTVLAKTVTGIARAEQAKQMAVETKEAAEASNKRKLASADAAADGESQPPPETEAKP